MAVLSMGSIWGGFAMPFLGLNAIMDAIARPLTQPTRYLAVAIVAAAVLAGVWFSSLGAKRQWTVFFLMLGEALLVGGLSLKLPTTELPQLSCQLPEGGVLLWPGDAEDGEQGRRGHERRRDSRRPQVSTGKRAELKTPLSDQVPKSLSPAPAAGAAA